MNAPDNLKYTKEHEWVLIQGKKATVGVTDYAQEQLGDIVYVELPEVEQEFSKDDTYGVLESVKAVSDCFMPLSGKVLERNEVLIESPEVVNEDCYGEGWMIKVQLSNPSEMESLLDHDQYEEFVKEETA